MSKERRLGRGLEALLGQLSGVRKETATAPVVPESSPTTTPAQPAGTLPAQGPMSTPSEVVAPSGEPVFRLDAPHLTGSISPLSLHRQPEQQGAAQPSPARPVDQAASSPPAPFMVSIKQIDSSPFQPRQDFDPAETAALAQSLSDHGLLQPIIVRKIGDRYQLIAGERRFRAAIQAGWTEVPVNVVQATDRQVAEIALIENLQRKDLNAIEKAVYFQKYLETFGSTQEELARRLNVDRSTVANMIRLLELPEAVKDAVRRGLISSGHARALLPLANEQDQIEFCKRIQREGLNVRQTERIVQEIIDQADREPLSALDIPAPPKRSKQAKSEHLLALEQQFRAALGMKVQISHNVRGRGRLTIHFRNHEEFARLKKHICGG